MVKPLVKSRDRAERLRADKDGMASFEYVIVAVCIVGAAGSAFSSTTAGNIALTLTNGIGAVTSAFTAVAGA